MPHSLISSHCFPLTSPMKNQTLSFGIWIHGKTERIAQPGGINLRTNDVISRLIRNSARLVASNGLWAFKSVAWWYVSDFSQSAITKRNEVKEVSLGVHEETRYMCSKSSHALTAAHCHSKLLAVDYDYQVPIHHHQQSCIDAHHFQMPSRHHCDFSNSGWDL